MSDLPLIVTAAGRAALVNAQHSGTAPVAIASVGVSSTAITATTATAALPGEIKRIAAISGDVVAPDTIHMVVRDDSDQIYAVRSFALYLGDGTLFAAYGQPGIIIEKSALSLLLLAIDVRFVDVAATSLTFGNTNFLNPPATETVDGVLRLATADEAAAGAAGRALTPQRAKASVFNWMGFTPVRQGAGAGQLTNVVSFGWSIGLRLKGQVDSTDLGNVVFDTHITNVWRSSNDGAGSGLDADLLDGQDGNYYSNITARLGFTPVRQGGGAGQMANSVLIGWSAAARLKGQVDAVDLGNFVFDTHVADVWRASNDGAGSGMDTDLFQGRSPSYFTDITARLGFTPVRQGGGAGQMANSVLIGWSGTRLKAQVDTVDQGNFVFDTHIANVWRASNDGAGSGMDTDLFQGRSPAYYTDITARLGYTPANRGGDVFTGDVQVMKPGAALSVHCPGVVIGRLVAQADGNLVLYRNDGAGDVPVFAIGSQGGPFGVSMPITRAGNTVWDAGNDGAGSGSDSDMLDGRHAIDFVLQADLDRVEVNDRRTAGTDTVTVPGWAHRAEVHIVGGGGGGAGGTDSFSGGGGGAGGYLFGIVNVSPGAVLTRIIGDGGAGGGAVGGVGGSSSLFTVGAADGGQGGTANASTCAGGGGGNAGGSTGMRGFVGGAGGDGNSFNPKIQGGNGAAGPFGGSGRSGSAGGIPGQAPGAGGGGVWNGAAGTGGAGAPGAVLIRWLP